MVSVNFTTLRELTSAAERRTRKGHLLFLYSLAQWIRCSSEFYAGIHLLHPIWSGKVQSTLINEMRAILKLPVCRIILPKAWGKTYTNLSVFDSRSFTAHHLWLIVKLCVAHAAIPLVKCLFLGAQLSVFGLKPCLKADEPCVCRSEPCFPGSSVTLVRLARFINTG